ncbi:MAG TPA: hypothetical protein VGA21_05915 [Cyclobacteriaceae bacterium]|jgi:hypothetical protein
MLKRQKFGWIIFILICSNLTPAQDIEFQLDEEGNAFYEDSVEVLNQNLDSAIFRISTWASGQVTNEQDTLIFTQSSSSGILLKKILRISLIEEVDSNYSFGLTLSVNLNSSVLRYKVYDIYHISLKTQQRCQNLGKAHGLCEFEGDDVGWSKVRIEMDREVRSILTNIEAFMSAK